MARRSARCSSSYQALNSSSIAGGGSVSVRSRPRFMRGESSRLAFGGGRELLEAAVDPQGGELFLNAVLREALGEGAEVDLVERLVLVEAGEDVAGLAGVRVDVGLQALGADLFHHALHRRVDGADRPVVGLQVRLQRDRKSVV